MKFAHIITIPAALVSGLLSLNAAAHALWLEGDSSGTTTTKLYFGEYAENLREPSPGRLDSIIEPAVTVVDAGGHGRPVEARRENNHFTIAGGATVLVQALKQPGAWIPPEKLAVISKAVHAQCPAESGYVEDPSQCRFDPSTLVCKAGESNDCLTDAQIRETMNGTLCRCMSYYRVQMAIKRAARTLAEISPVSNKGVVA